MTGKQYETERLAEMCKPFIEYRGEKYHTVSRLNTMKEFKQAKILSVLFSAEHKRVSGEHPLVYPHPYAAPPLRGLYEYGNRRSACPFEHIRLTRVLSDEILP